MHPIPLRLKLLVVLFLGFLPAVSGQAFHLHLPQQARPGRRIVSMGFVAAKGRYDDNSTPCIHMGSRRLRAQTRVRSRWPDGSYRWLQLTFPARLGRDRPLRVLVRPKSTKFPPRLPPTPFVLTPEDGGSLCSNGKIRFVVTRDPGNVLQKLGWQGKSRPHVKSVMMGQGIGEAGIEVEDSGPYAMTLLVRGLIQSRPGTCPMQVTRRLTFWADASEVSVESWLDSAGEEVPRGGVRLRFELDRPVSTFRTTRREEKLKTSILPLRLSSRRNGRIELAGSSGSFDWDKDYLVLGQATANLVLSLSDLAEKHPGTIQLLEDDAGDISIVSDSYHWYRGVRPGRRVVLGLAVRREKSVPMYAHMPLVAAATPASSKKSESPPLAGESELAEKLRRVIAIELDTDRARRRGFVWGGEENFGDWRWNASDAGNLEYDTTAGLRAAARYLRQPRLLGLSRAAVRHLFQRDLADSGLPLMHSAYHRQGGIESGHMWLQGVLDESVHSGDPFLADAVERMIESWHVVSKRLLSRSIRSRSVSWALLFATELYQFGDTERCKPVVKGLLDKIAHAPGGSIPLFDPMPKSDGLFQVAPWVMVGILGEALWKAPPLSWKKACVGRFLRATQRILALAWRGPETGLARSITMPGVGDEAVFVGGRATGEEALFFSLGLSRAVQMGADRSLLKPAAEICRWALAHLAIERGAFSGMRLSQILWVYPRLFGEYPG